MPSFRGLIRASSRRVRCRQKQPDFRQHFLNAFAAPQGHRSLRPSFSCSSLSPWTTRWPRLTPVSDGKPLRRLLVVVKAEVFGSVRFHEGSPGGWTDATGRHSCAESAKHLQEKVPVTGSGAAQSLRPVSAASSVSSRAASGSGAVCRIRTGVSALKTRSPDHLDEHDVLPLRLCPMREPSRRMRRLAARGPGKPDSAHPAPRTPRGLRRRSAGAHPK